MLTSTISDFKAHLSEKLRSVRAGAHIIILDRDHPVAEVRPVENFSIVPGMLRATKAFSIPSAPSWKIKGDVMALLADERGET